MRRGRMATGFFLLAHDEFSGRTRIGPDAVRCGLVGAQVADLVIAGHLTMDGHRVAVVRADSSGLDELGTLVLQGVAHATGAHTVREWTATLGPALHEQTVARLTGDGVLRAETRRGPLARRRVRYPAVDLVRARRPAVELAEMFDDPRRFDLPGAFVGALLTTLDAESVLEPGVGRDRVRSVAAQAVDHLPASLSRLRDGVADALARD